MDKFRVISDLHTDLNARFGVSFRKDDIFTVVAGDIGGDVNQNCQWLKKNISNGVFVAGNHIVYNAFNTPIEDFKEAFHKEFPVDAKITFLDESVGVIEKEIDGIVFIGSTLYTDYKYQTGRYHDSVDATIRQNMRYAYDGLNDFRVGKTRERAYPSYVDAAAPDIYMLSPENYRGWHEKTMKAFKEALARHADKEVVIVTHHCPSPRCISEQYVGNELNASYVSDLEGFIKKHDNIKCWCCGHVHHKDSFKVGNCLVVMNPLGYCKYGGFMERGAEWSFDTFVNTKTWELEVKPRNIARMKRAYNAEVKRVHKLYSDYWSAFMV